MIIHVLDQTLQRVGVVDSFSSIIWRPAYYDVGDFELYLDATKAAIDLLKPGRYLVRDVDVSVIGETTIYRKVMMIQGIDIITDEEDGDHISVTGKELKSILHQRIVWQQTTLTGTAEEGIYQLVTENAISPADPARVIPLLTIGAARGFSDSIDKQITGDYLDEAIKDICETYGYGWDIDVVNGEMVLFVYKGIDRSFNQSMLPYVVFSETFDNLYHTEYQLITDDYANTTLVAGEGEGTARVTAVVGGEHEGLDRFETYTDARNVSRNNGTISMTDYIELLKGKGSEALAERQITEGFGGEILSDVAYVYGRDFDLGDRVTIINKYGISRDVVILSAIESLDGDGEKLIPQFNI